MTTLRAKLIRLAHSNPELRPHILPLVKTAAYRPQYLLATVKDLVNMGVQAEPIEVVRALKTIQDEVGMLLILLNRQEKTRGLLRGAYAKNLRLHEELNDVFESLAVPATPVSETPAI
jgi:hypothetical protein